MSSNWNEAPNYHLEIYAFKKTRTASALKHTGIQLVIRYPSFGHEEYWIHEVTGGAPMVHDHGSEDEENCCRESSNSISKIVNISQTATKSSLVLRKQGDDEEATFEEKLFITKVKRYIKWNPDQQMVETHLKSWKLFQYEWKYHLITNNCRDQVIFFIDRLKQFGYSVDPKVKEWVESIKEKDVAVVTGVGIALLLGVVVGPAVVTGVGIALLLGVVGLAKVLTSGTTPDTTNRMKNMMNK